MHVKTLLDVYCWSRHLPKRVAGDVSFDFKAVMMHDYDERKGYHSQLLLHKGDPHTKKEKTKGEHQWADGVLLAQQQQLLSDGSRQT